MLDTDCYRLAKVLLPQLSGFVTNKRNKIFIAPIGDVWRGFLFESAAGEREDFYFWWFFMPICSLDSYPHLNFGERLNVPGGNAGWRSDMPDLPDKLLAAMRPKALPLLQSLHSIQDTFEAIYELRGTREIYDTNILDNIACLQILDGQFDAALTTLDSLIAHEKGRDRRQWILDIVERMKGLRTKLKKDPQLAVDQVRDWQNFTFKALKLEKWR